jgi:hypothetical protein
MKKMFALAAVLALVAGSAADQAMIDSLSNPSAYVPPAAVVVE